MAITRTVVLGKVEGRVKRFRKVLLALADEVEVSRASTSSRISKLRGKRHVSLILG